MFIQLYKIKDMYIQNTYIYQNRNSLIEIKNKFTLWLRKSIIQIHFYSYHQDKHELIQIQLYKIDINSDYIYKYTNSNV